MVAKNATKTNTKSPFHYQEDFLKRACIRCDKAVILAK